MKSWLRRDTRVGVSLECVNGYFVGELGPSCVSEMRTPGSRWGAE